MDSSAQPPVQPRFALTWAWHAITLSIRFEIPMAVFIALAVTLATTIAACATTKRRRSSGAPNSSATSDFDDMPPLEHMPPLEPAEPSNDGIAAGEAWQGSNTVHAESQTKINRLYMHECLEPELPDDWNNPTKQSRNHMYRREQFSRIVCNNMSHGKLCEVFAYRRQPVRSALTKGQLASLLFEETDGPTLAMAKAAEITWRGAFDPQHFYNREAFVHYRDLESARRRQESDPDVIWIGSTYAKRPARGPGPKAPPEFANWEAYVREHPGATHANTHPQTVVDWTHWPHVPPAVLAPPPGPDMYWPPHAPLGPPPGKATAATQQIDLTQTPFPLPKPRPPPGPPPDNGVLVPPPPKSAALHWTQGGQASVTAPAVDAWPPWSLTMTPLIKTPPGHPPAGAAIMPPPGLPNLSFKAAPVMRKEPPLLQASPPATPAATPAAATQTQPELQDEDDPWFSPEPVPTHQPSHALHEESQRSADMETTLAVITEE